MEKKIARHRLMVAIGLAGVSWASASDNTCRIEANVTVSGSQISGPVDQYNLYSGDQRVTSGDSWATAVKNMRFMQRAGQCAPPQPAPQCGQRINPRVSTRRDVYAGAATIVWGADENELKDKMNDLIQLGLCAGTLPKPQRPKMPDDVILKDGRYYRVRTCYGSGWESDRAWFFSSACSKALEQARRSAQYNCDCPDSSCVKKSWVVSSAKEDHPIETNYYGSQETPQNRCSARAIAERLNEVTPPEGGWEPSSRSTGNWESAEPSSPSPRPAGDDIFGESR